MRQKEIQEAIFKYLGSIWFPQKALKGLDNSYSVRYEGFDRLMVETLLKNIGDKFVQKSLIFGNHEVERLAQILQFEFSRIKKALVQYYLEKEQNELAKAYFVKVLNGLDKMSLDVEIEEAALADYVLSQHYSKILRREMLTVMLLFPEYCKLEEEKFKKLMAPQI